MKEKRVVKIKAETEARQQGMGISETVEIGKKAMLEIKDVGPEDTDKLSNAEALIEEHECLNSLWLVKKCSQLRIEDGAELELVVEWVAQKKQLLEK